MEGAACCAEWPPQPSMARRRPAARALEQQQASDDCGRVSRSTDRPHRRRGIRQQPLVAVIVGVAAWVVLLLALPLARAEGGLRRGGSSSSSSSGSQGGSRALAPVVAAEAQAPPQQNMVCDGMVLDDMLGELEDIPECSIPYARFYDRIREPRFNSETLSEQNRKLNDFCKSPCGRLFEEKVAAWRAWCAGPEAKLVPIQSNGNTYRMAGFIAVFGCTTSATAADDAAHPILEQEAAVGITTSYCATLAMGAMTGSPQLHGEAAEAAVCAYYQSCCFGEDYKLMRLTRPLNLAAIEARCPGAMQAFNSQCVNAAVTKDGAEAETAPAPPGEPKPKPLPAAPVAPAAAAEPVKPAAPAPAAPAAAAPAAAAAAAPAAAPAVQGPPLSAP